MGPVPSRSVSQDETRLSLVSLRESIDRNLARLLGVGEANDPVSLAMQHSTLAPGKRVRPLLLLLAAQELGAPRAAAVELACAVEMVHSASLVLDDLPCMDNASLRRGQPTTHRQFGEDVAMLAAIALLSRAFAVIAAVPEVDAERRAQISARLAETVGQQGLVQGQYRDLHEQRHGRSASEIYASNHLKTGVLFEAALDIAALLANAESQLRRSLAGFADELGQAFQLCDDLLDDSPGQGKDVDQDRDKATLVSLVGKEAVRARLNEHLQQADRYLLEVFPNDNPISRFVRQLFEPVRTPAPSQLAAGG